MRSTQAAGGAKGKRDWTKPRLGRLAIVAIPAAGLLLAAAARAQLAQGDWMTSANDPQRSSWVRNDGKISLKSMSSPGFRLAWKIKPENGARQLNSLTTPALLDFYIGYRGFRALGFIGGSSDRVIAVDTELSRVEWEKNYSASTHDATGTLGCPGGLTSAVTRPTETEYPPIPTGHGEGRGTPAKSGVGEPHKGAVTLKEVDLPEPPKPRRPKPAPGKNRIRPVVNPYAPRVQVVQALTGDGKLHSLWVSNGNEPKAAVQFIPPNSKAHGLVSYDGVTYVATTGGCGGGNGIWAIDLATAKVNRWKTEKNVAGDAGPAVGPDGTLYAAAGNQLIALSPGKLETLGVYKTGGAEFTSSPVVFEFKGKDLIAATTDDGRLELVSAGKTNKLSGVDKSAAFSSPGYTAGSVTSWQDTSGNRWILAAAGGSAASSGFPVTNGDVTNGAIAAWKVVEKNGAPALEAAWTSRDMTSPLPPIVVNGVIFALSSGEFRSSDASLSAADRAGRSANAVLYALNPSNGKELWNSGTTIDSFVHSAGLAAGGSRVLVAGYDGTQYAFGFPIEH